VPCRPELNTAVAEKGEGICVNRIVVGRHPRAEHSPEPRTGDSQ
jgi:hypothetical protein